MKWFPAMRWQAPDTDPDRRHWRTARWPDWEMVWNAVGAERCPRCAALVQTQVRYVHEDEHDRSDDFERSTHDALVRILDELGISHRHVDDDDDDRSELLPCAEQGIVIGDTGLGTGTEQRL